MLVQKTKKESIHEHAHVEIWKDGIFLGYFMKNKSKNAVINENWNFTTKCFDTLGIPNFHTRTKKELLQKLTDFNK